MRGGEKMKKLLLLLVLVFTVSAFAYGDTSMLYMLEDPQEEPRVFGFYDYTYYLEADVKGQDTDFTMHQQSAGCLVPFNIDQDSELFFYAKFDQIKWDTDAMFTGTNVSLPNDVYDLNLFTGYKQVLDNGWLVGGVAQFGSASDKLFHSADEFIYGGRVFVKVPSNDTDYWVFLLDYSSNRAFLQYVPLPGVGYMYNPNEKIKVFAGVPFAFIEYKPTEKIKLEVSYFPVSTVNAKASYKVDENWTLFADYVWKEQKFYR